MGTTILTEIIGILTGGLTGMATGLGAGLTSLVSAIFLETKGETTSLSVFGSVIIVFAGISLAVGLSRWVVNWVTSLGASH